MQRCRGAAQPPAAAGTHAPLCLTLGREKAKELEVAATRRLGCDYYALEYQGHGASSPNFLDCTLQTWCDGVCVARV